MQNDYFNTKVTSEYKFLNFCDSTEVLDILVNWFSCGEYFYHLISVISLKTHKHSHTHTDEQRYVDLMILTYDFNCASSCGMWHFI